MSRFDFIQDLIEDIRHGSMVMRRMHIIKSEDIRDLTATTGRLLVMTERAKDEQLEDADRIAIEGANYLQHRFEEDLTFLLHLDNV